MSVATAPPPTASAPPGKPPRARNLEEAQRIIDRLWHERWEATSRHSLFLAGLRNPQVKPQQYLSAHAASAYLASVPPEERAAGGWCKVPLGAIAEGASCSTDTASTHITQVLVETGIVERERRRGLALVRDPQTGEPILDERGEPLYREVWETWLRERVPTHGERLVALTTVTPPSYRPSGGPRTPARPTCPDHPEAATVERWSVHCAVCDRQLDPEEHRSPPARTGESAGRPARQDQPPAHWYEEETRAADRDDRAAGIPEPATCGFNPPLVAPAAIGDERMVNQLDRIAGNCPRHIAMQPTGNRKYDWQKDALGNDLPLTRDLLRAHLAGEQTIGSELRWLAGEGRGARTYALAWDADNTRDFARLQAAARRLWQAGARPVLERSPSRQNPGGGRLWLWFADAVDPGAAWATAIHHAPYLARFREHWPNWRLGPDDRGQAVRLPAGVYHRDGERAPIPHAAWRPEGLIWRRGRHAAALLLSELTPGDWVSQPPPPAPPDEPPRTPPAIIDLAPVARPAAPPLPAALSDPEWLARYGHNRHHLDFAITEKEAIAWYNARHDVQQLLPKERNGYARAAWRDEVTPSVAYLPNNAWIDYGNSPYAKPGRRDGGDAFEALCRLTGRERGEVLKREVLPALLAEARRLLEGAGRTRAGVPGWVAAITTPQGWAHYDALPQGAGSEDRQPR